MKIFAFFPQSIYWVFFSNPAKISLIFFLGFLPKISYALKLSDGELKAAVYDEDDTELVDVTLGEKLTEDEWHTISLLRYLVFYVLLLLLLLRGPWLPEGRLMKSGWCPIAFNKMILERKPWEGYVFDI